MQGTSSLPVGPRWSVSLLSLALLASATPARAQTRASNPSGPGWYLIPELDVSAVYDDNLFFNAGIPESSAYARLGAGLSVERQSPGKVFRSGYSFSSEIFPTRLDELTDLLARQNAYARFNGRVGARSEMSLNVSLLASKRPEDPSGIELGRRRSKSYNLNLSHRRRLNAAHSWDLGYGFGFRELSDRLELGLDTKNYGHNLSTSWVQRYSARTSGSLRYAYRLIFQPDLTVNLSGDDELQSHVVDYRWSTVLTPRTNLTFALGPRYSQSYVFAPEPSLGLEKAWRLAPEARIAIGHRRPRHSFDIAYVRSQFQSFGLVGVSETHSVAGSWQYEPVQRFSFTVSPGYYRNRRAEMTVETIRAVLRARWDMSRSYQLDISYRVSHQNGLFPLVDGTPLPRDGNDLTRQVVRVTLNFGRAFRVN